MLPFLNRLAIRLALGAEHWNETVRQESADFFWSAQNSNGGFVGRKGTGDLYYSGFALRGLALLGALSDSEQTRSIEQFLLFSLDQPFRTIDVFSLISSSFLLELATSRNIFAVKGLNRTDWSIEKLLQFQRPDGGFASSDQALYSSTYHTFLSYAALELLGPEISLKTPEECRHLLNLLLNRQRQDNGFAELAPLPQGGTNPTTAAIQLLQMLREKWTTLEKVPPSLLQELDVAIEQGMLFLKQQLVPGSGFRAHSKIPIPDLLSTFTALVILVDSPLLSQDELNGIRSFVESLKRPRGGQIGFAGGAWDREPDVEFTFYGLGTLALLDSVEN